MTPVDPDHQRLLERTVEEDTRIFAARYFRINDIPIFFEKWTADGLRGTTAVFLPEHVAGMNDEALQRFLREVAGIDLRGGVTITRGAHVFVNFGFEMKG